MTTVRWTRRLGLLILHMVAACQSRGEPEKAPPASSSSTTEPQWLPPPPPPSRPAPDGRTATLVVQDERHVELLDIVRQATALVHRLEPGAELVDVGALELHEGTIDLHAAPARNATIVFAYTKRDPGQPPGKDVDQGTIRVAQDQVQLHAEWSPRSGHIWQVFGPLPEIGCTIREAWAQVLSSGVPANAVVQVTSWRTSPKSTAEWLFRVDGHEEYQRKVDMKSCPKNGPMVSPKPKLPEALACTCEKGDMLCDMRCSARQHP